MGVFYLFCGDASHFIGLPFKVICHLLLAIFVAAGCPHVVAQCLAPPTLGMLCLQSLTSRPPYNTRCYQTTSTAIPTKPPFPLPLSRTLDSAAQPGSLCCSLPAAPSAIQHSTVVHILPSCIYATSSWCDTATAHLLATFMLHVSAQVGPTLQLPILLLPVPSSSAPCRTRTPLLFMCTCCRAAVSTVDTIFPTML